MTHFKKLLCLLSHVTLVNKCTTGFNSSTTEIELNKETTIMIININTLSKNKQITHYINIANTNHNHNNYNQDHPQKKKRHPNLERIIDYHILPRLLNV